MKISPLKYTNNKLTFEKQKTEVVMLKPEKKEGDTYILKDEKNNLVAKATIIGTAGLAIAGLVSVVVNAKKGNIARTTSVTGASATDVLSDIVITSKKKFSEIISNFMHDDYDANKAFKVNLHMHSTFSDGKMTPLDILEQARKRAEQLPAGEKFTFSLTDHDTIDGVKIIVDEIAKNPKKYEKIQFVPGVEMSVKFHNNQLSKNPMTMDFLIYAFDINNPALLAQLEKRKSYLASQTQAVFDELNKRDGTDFSVKKMQESATNEHLKNMVSNGYLKALVRYLEDESPGPTHEYVRKFFGYDKYAYDANISLVDAVKLSKEINAFSSLAHPGKLNTKQADVIVDSHLTLTDDIIRTFFKEGGDGMESHYMSYNESNQHWWEEIRDSFKKLNLQYHRTGGYDSHGSVITAKK